MSLHIDYLKSQNTFMIETMVMNVWHSNIN